MPDPDAATELIIEALDDGADVPARAEAPLLDDGGKIDDLPAGAQRQDDGSVTYTLRHACAVRYRSTATGATREEAVSSLRLHRLTGADMRAITAASAEMMSVVAIARSTRTENHAKMRLIFDAMDAEDAAAVVEIVGGFLGTGRKTGR